MMPGLGEVLIGYRVDADVGPLVMLAAGGVLAEIHRDRSLRLAPVDLAEAKAMIGEVAALKALAGYRGRPAGRSRRAGAGAGGAVAARGSTDGPAVAEAEVNPLIVRPKGEGVVAVDALVKLGVGGQSHDRTHADLVNSDANLVRRGRFLSTTFLLGDRRPGLSRQDHRGPHRLVTPGPFVTPNYSFALRAPRDEWEMFWKKVPAPGHNDIFALFKRGKLTIEGDLHPFMANLLYIKDVLAAPRKEAAPMSPRFEPITGRYLNLDLLGRPHRLYIEEAGQGIPLLCLHTAGSDGRQYRGLLNDKRVTDNYRVIVFDMPWHGKSSPPEGYQNEEYKLTSRGYIQMILEIADALELDKPVVMGCSIGGRIALYLAHQHAKRFRAIIGLESAAACRALLRRRMAAPAATCTAARSRPASCPGWSRRPRRTTTAGKRCGTTCKAGPASSRATCTSTRSTATSAARSTRSTASAANLYLLTGEYDYSCTTEGTLDIARRTGAQATIMKGLGHFPMSEDPPKFIGYLLPVLEKIRAS